jgi:hypothetical protein
MQPTPGLKTTPASLCNLGRFCLLLALVLKSRRIDSRDMLTRNVAIPSIQIPCRCHKPEVIAQADEPDEIAAQVAAKAMPSPACYVGAETGSRF